MTDTKTNDYAFAALRAASGIAFIAHGLMKLMVFTPAGTAAYFESMGIPGFLSYLVILGEIGGGLALILGVAVRLVSIPLVLILLGAVWAHAGNGWFFSNPNGGWEYPLFWAVIQAAIGVVGAGAFALRIPALNKTLGAFA